VTDGWAAPHRGGSGQAAPAGSATTGFTSGFASGSPWWSNALADPWRDPDTSALVKVTPSIVDSPPLETEDPTVPVGGRRGLGLVFMVALVTALLAGSLGGALGFFFATRGGTLPGGESIGTGPLTQRAPDSLAGIVKKVLPSVVTVRVRNGTGFAIGSGFIVSGDGFLITNDHVVSGSSGQATVTFSDASTASARVVGADVQSDVAVLKIDRSGLPPVQFGNSDTVQVGDPVLAMGSPLALANTVTYGIVSAVDRPVQADEPGGPTRYYAAIQTDAAINHGNSGGPLVDMAGQVVGINSVITSPSASDEKTAGNVGLAFAIPINQAKRLAQEIINTGKARRTVIGAELDGAYRNPGGGVRLSTVEPNGPAAAAGLHAGDVLVRLDGRPLEEPGDLIALVRKYAPGTGVKVEYVRAGARLVTQVTLGADAN
jgi:putative serine protease PepD